MRPDEQPTAEDGADDREECCRSGESARLSPAIRHDALVLIAVESVASPDLTNPLSTEIESGGRSGWNMANAQRDALFAALDDDGRRYVLIGEVSKRREIQLAILVVITISFFSISDA
jgi:hypothetical protein